MSISWDTAFVYLCPSSSNRNGILIQSLIVEKIKRVLIKNNMNYKRSLNMASQEGSIIICYSFFKRPASCYFNDYKLISS